MASTTDENKSDQAVSVANDKPENKFAKDYLIVKFPLVGWKNTKLWSAVCEFRKLKHQILRSFEDAPPTMLAQYLQLDARLAELGVSLVTVGKQPNLVVSNDQAELVAFIKANLPEWAKIKKRLR